MMIQGVFFDLDGTLFDTVSDIIAAYRSVFGTMGIFFDPEKLTIGPPLTECLRQFKPDITPEESDFAVAAFRDFYDGCGYPGTIAYPGIPEMLAALQEKKIKLFVATNKRLSPTMGILEQKGVLPFFAAVYACDSDPVQKRTKAEYLQMAMAQYGLSPEHCLMVGDTHLDVNAGHTVGLRVVGVTWGYDENGALAAAKPDWTIHRADELLNIVEEA